MPSLGMYTIEGQLTRWLIPNGAAVRQDQPVLELTTEKTTVEINAPAAGVLHHVLPEGALVRVQGLLGCVLAPGEAPPAPPVLPATPVHDIPTGPGPQELPEAVRPAASLAGAAPKGVAASAANLGDDRPASPLARRRAAELGVDLAQVVGTGPGGRITEADVERAAAPAATGLAPPGVVATLHSAAAGAPGMAPGAPGVPSGAPGVPPVLRRVPLTGMRGLIARRMHESLRTTAQLTLTLEIDAGPLVAAREALAAAHPGVRVSYNVLLAKALAAALTERPDLNAVVHDDAILVLADVHVGVAVAVEGGLVVPVLHHPAQRDAPDLARELAALVERAQQGRLSPLDMEGGTVTLTNLGGHGVDSFTPILNPPQSAILGAGRIAPRPVADAGGHVVVRPTLHLSLTFDHRVADGAVAAALLEGVAARCAAPMDR